MRAVILDDVQLTAATVPPETRQIVLAGPGAGKSEVVGALAANLVEKFDVYPEQILVVSFSRAAVGVVEQRTRDVTDQGEVVEVRTIDSLAAQTIIDLGDDDAAFRGYDRAIEEATRLLRESDDLLRNEIQHIIVDEVQDVVGMRAEFVLEYLRSGIAGGSGFTLLGDPLQALYDFQLNSKHAMSCATFLDKVRSEFGARLIELPGEHRSQTTDARRVADLRHELISLPPAKRLASLGRVHAALSPLGELDEDAVTTIGGWKGRTALLCDTNARAALVAARLAENGLASETAAGAADRSLPAWLASTLATHPTDRIDQGSFLTRATGADCPNPTDAWRTMLELAGAGPDVDIRELAMELGQPRGRNLFRRVPQSRVLVSTVHRAKGLEFDNVVLVDPDDWVDADAEDAQRLAPMLYVALSRARGRVTTVDGIDERRWHRASRVATGAPWIKKSWRGKGLLGVIMEPFMARALGPSGLDPASLTGHDVRWEATDDLVAEADEAVPSWAAFVGDAVVARTGADFGRLIGKFAWRGDRPALVGGHVDGFETLVGPRRGDGPGRYGLWLSTRVTGPIDLDWK